MTEAVKKYVSIWNSNDISSLEDIFSEESTYWDALQEGEAIDLLSGSIASTHRTFSDVLFRIISLKTIRKNQAFLAWQMNGTNTGEFFGYPPTGKKIEIRGLDSLTFKSGRITEIKSFYDSSLFATQLGIQ